ncbi:MAG: DUF4968 domain-containing protein, partial [Chitinispirillaceae bacterium]|nr:DUF4968 domain-containing protein [Chitinispirillaceae bacterium]
WPAVTFTVDSTSDSAVVIIRTAELTVRVQKAPFRISFYKADGTYLTGDAAAMESAGTRDTMPAFTFTQRPDEHYFGWGLAMPWFKGSYREIDNKGKKIGHRSETACYMYSTGGYGLWLLFAEPAPSGSVWSPMSSWWSSTGAGFNLEGATAKYWMNPSSDYSFGGPMEYASYFFFSGTWKEAMSSYTLISGRPPRLNKKYYGIMRGLYYRSGTTITTMRGWADMFRTSRFNMDWVRMDNFFDWTNLGYLPEVPNPGCWNSEVPEVIQYYRAKGFLFGGMSAGWGLYGCCSAGCTRNLLQDSLRCKTAIDHGFDFAWYDAMNIQRRSIARQQYEVWKRAYDGDESKVFISRGCQALSSQAWPGSTSGDYLNQEWNVTRKYAVFPSALMEHLVGYAWSHTSLGEGYDFNYIGISLRPMISFHMAGAAGGSATNFEECGRIGTYANDLKNVMRKWGNFHYQFIPYLFTYGMIANETGVPPWRAMMCQNGGERDPKTHNLAYQCYVGEELIVSPYYDDNPEDLNSGSRHNIYLPPVPSGAWYDYFSGTRYAAGTTIASYLCDPGKSRDSLRLPLFVKSGSIIPLMDTLQFVGERPESLITLHVWPWSGTGNFQTGSFTLYEDEGTASAPPSRTTFSYRYDQVERVKQAIVTIGPFHGSRYCSSPAQRVYRVEFHAIARMEQVRSSNLPLPVITETQYHAGVPGWFWHPDKGGMCRINAVGDAAQGFTVWAYEGGIPVNPRAMNNPLRDVTIIRVDRGVRVSLPMKGTHRVELFTLQGGRVMKEAGNGPATYLFPLRQRYAALYIVKVTAGDRTLVRKTVW